MTMQIAIFLFLASFASITCWLVCRDPAPPRVAQSPPTPEIATSEPNHSPAEEPVETTEEIPALADVDRMIQQRLTEVVIPVIDIENESLVGIMQYLHLKLQETESGQLSSVRFIVRKPSTSGQSNEEDITSIDEDIPRVEEQTFTIRETNVTLAQILGQICQQGGYRWAVEEQVIIFTPIGS